jgi:hypothetical protein
MVGNSDSPQGAPTMAGTLTVWLVSAHVRARVATRTASAAPICLTRERSVVQVHYGPPRRPYQTRGFRHFRDRLSTLDNGEVAHDQSVPVVRVTIGKARRGDIATPSDRTGYDITFGQEVAELSMEVVGFAEFGRLALREEKPPWPYRLGGFLCVGAMRSKGGKENTPPASESSVRVVPLCIGATALKMDGSSDSSRIRRIRDAGLRRTADVRTWGRKKPPSGVGGGFSNGRVWMDLGNFLARSVDHRPYA